MNKVQNDNAPPLAVRLALGKIDDVELAISASIDQFVQTVSTSLRSTKEPSPAQRRAMHTEVLPCPENDAAAS